MLGRVDDASQTSWGKYALRGFCYNPCLGTEERRVSGAKQRQISCRGDSLELITNFRQHVSDPPWEQQSRVGVNDQLGLKKLILALWGRKQSALPKANSANSGMHSGLKAALQ